MQGCRSEDGRGDGGGSPVALGAGQDGAMTGVWQVLLLSLLPGLGNFAGEMVAEFGRTSPRLLNLALHAASGIVIAIVAVELMPEAVDVLAGWWLALAFAAGGVAYLLAGDLIGRLQKRADRGGGERTGAWMIYVAVAVDLTSDGLMLGTGSAVSASLAIVLALGQVLADLPEGYAVIANFRDKKVPRRRRVLLSASFVVFSVGAALLAFLLLRDAAEATKMAVLTFVAGLLTVAAVEDMLEEAHEAREDNRASILAFVGGFAVFTPVSAGLETALAGGGGTRDDAGRLDRGVTETIPAPVGSR